MKVAELEIDSLYICEKDSSQYWGYYEGLVPYKEGFASKEVSSFYSSFETFNRGLINPYKHVLNAHNSFERYNASTIVCSPSQHVQKGVF